MSSELERTLLPSSEATGAVHEVCVCSVPHFQRGENHMMMYFLLAFHVGWVFQALCVAQWQCVSLSRRDVCFVASSHHTHSSSQIQRQFFFFRACSGVGERVRSGRVSRLRLTQHRLPQLTTIPIKSRTRESRHDNPHAAATPITATNQAF